MAQVVGGDGYVGGGMDMWSAGVILHILLSGYPPWMDDDLTVLFKMIGQGKLEFAEGNGQGSHTLCTPKPRALLLIGALC